MNIINLLYLILSIMAKFLKPLWEKADSTLFKYKKAELIKLGKEEYNNLNKVIMQQQDRIEELKSILQKYEKESINKLYENKVNALKDKAKEIVSTLQDELEIEKIEREKTSELNKELNITINSQNKLIKYLKSKLNTPLKSKTSK